MLLPSLMTLRQPREIFEVDITGAAVLGGIIGVLHVFAWRSNNKEIAKIREFNLTIVLDMTNFIG